MSPAPFTLTIPTAEQLKAARLAMGLSQAQAAELVHLGHLTRWSEMERGIGPIDPARWELFTIKCGMHPHYKPARGVKLPKGKAGLGGKPAHEEPQQAAEPST